ncbi:cuticle protein 64-like [Odontomachus brunneus]|uniref:cuticle protein 64-like n=1 Tax=Odontomachus brunneus TaxID=486640 RepID=UPI0013F2A4AB|nr:cuticle protein 64-like [Odontomachus brunneus]
MKCFIVLLAIVAAVSAGGYGGYGHGPQVIHLPAGPQIPAQNPAPLAPHGNDHTTRIHYSGSHVGHPHLVGVEHYNAAPHYEPSVTNVAVGHGGGYGGYGHH